MDHNRMIELISKGKEDNLTDEEVLEFAGNIAGVIDIKGIELTIDEIPKAEIKRMHDMLIKECKKMPEEKFNELKTLVSIIPKI